jgi:hypothetical protein
LQVPAILAHHEVFLEELRKRLEHWDIKQKVGDVFLDVVSKMIFSLMMLCQPEIVRYNFRVLGCNIY